MTIFYFGRYNPKYSRNRVLIKGLKQNGVKVLECSSSHKNFFAFLELFFKYFKFIGKFDLMIVGFPGQEIMFLARFLTRKPIVFDAFTSHYGGYILDRQHYSSNSFRAKYYRFLDKWSCKLASLVLLDTNSHIDFFVREFGLPREKFRRIFVGTDSDVFYPKKIENKSDKFLVHFHGHYIPLHGVKHIIEAAKILKNEDILFNLIGRGQTFEEDRKLAEKLGLKNINFIDSVPYDKLPDYMAQADVCLGIFGDSPKTELVIPNKVYEALAMEKPVITADTPAIRELFNDRDLALVERANPEALAKKILELKADKQLCLELAENAYKKFKTFCTPEVLGKELRLILEEII